MLIMTSFRYVRVFPRQMKIACGGENFVNQSKILDEDKFMRVLSGRSFT